MKKKYIGILSGCLMTALIGLVFAKAGFTLSWFDQDKNIPQNLTAESVASYFGGGKGTDTEPYLIRGARHFYNLAWLQYLGRFNEEKSDENSDGRKILTQYYFMLENDIDMNGYVLPPIGTTTNPFIGNFNGNDHVVKNLVVSDNYSEMKRHPVKASEYVDENKILKDCDIIGTFGVVGLYDTQMNKYTISNEINAVTGLYLDNVEIKPSKTNVLAGIICGYSGGSITDSGAHYCKLNLKKGTSRLSKYDKISKYTLIGDYDNSRVTGKGDYGYGSSLDLKKLSEMLSNYSDFKADGEKSIQVKSGYAIPLYADSNNQGVTYDETKKTTSIQGWTGIGDASGMISFDITQARSWKANNDNIGYYVGSDCKLYNDTKLSSFIPKNESLPFYNPVTNEKIPDSSVSDIRQYFMEQANNDISSPIYSMRLTGDQPKLDKTEDFVYINNGTIQGMQENIVAPTRCIWIAPRYSGTFRFVFYGKNSSFTLKKIMRMNPKGNSYGYGFDCNAYNGEKNESLLKYDPTKIEKGKLYYFTYSVSQEEINGGTEFVLSFSKSGNSSDQPYFCYLDVGQSGGGQQKVNVIENVDFIKTNGTKYIFTDDSTFKLSNVIFEVSFTPDKNTAETFIFYFRRHNDDGTGVLYYVNRDDQSGEPAYISKKGSGNYGYAKDLNCNSKV